MKITTASNASPAARNILALLVDRVKIHITLLSQQYLLVSWLSSVVPIPLLKFSMFYYTSLFPLCMDCIQTRARSSRFKCKIYESFIPAFPTWRWWHEICIYKLIANCNQSLCIKRYTTNSSRMHI